MENNQPKYKVGNIVTLKADSARKGPIIEILPPVQGQYRYKIFHSTDDIREYLEDQITIISVGTETPGSEKVISPEEFVVRLNSFRLSHPLTDSLYALHAARIRFIPFQFKPLLRFLRADKPRLLIADEVGVGKTIEAGMILRELQSRQELKNVLIVCPKALVQKWNAEMRRFDEDFKPLTAETLKYCIKETQSDGIWPNQYARSIVHLELLRREEYLEGIQGKKQRPGLVTLDPPPQFDLLIVDEAHHLRTPDSKTNKLARFLCDISESVVFLTATPIQLGSENLFTLLNLLRPDQFLDEPGFEEMIVPNRHINQAIRHIRMKQPKDTWQSDAYSELNKANNTPWGQGALQKDPRFSRWITYFKENRVMADEERIRFIRDMEDIHTLAHVMNRTRRRDIGKFTIREPFTIRVPFTEDQQCLYDAIISFRKEVLRLSYDPLVIRLIINILERQAASCLPALIPALDKFISTGRFSTITDDLESENDFNTLPNSLTEKAEELREMASSLPDNDPKLDGLLKVVSETIHSEGPGKVLIFSYFLHTLSYLERHLQKRGYRVAVITGEIDDDVREIIRERFRLSSESPDAIDVLLSSEVGCEGLDYEFCSHLVNYDIPWNPMRIEQRIGRIDRFGQKSEKVQIYNFITPGTIEERIFSRCFERLGIFKETIGDMEEVLGELTEELTRMIFDPSLTPEQMEAKLQQLADNKIRKIEEQRRLEESSTELLGLDTAFQEEVEKIEKEGRYVLPDEIKRIMALYLEARCKNAKLLADTKQEKLIKLQAYKEDRNTLLEDLNKLKRQDRQTLELKRWLEGSESYFTMTFDQETALEHRSIPFITPIHPLTKIAVNYWNSRKTPLFVNLEVKDSGIQPGMYVFAFYLWEVISFRSEVRLLPLVWSIKEDKPASAISEKLLKLLNQTHSATSSVSLSQKQLDYALHKLEESIHDNRIREVEKLRDINYQLAGQRLASLNRYYQRRIARVEEELTFATDDRIRRMKTSEKDCIQREWEKKRGEIEERKKADIISQRIAYGIMEVKNS
ncbi:MAG: hypothetical protein FJ264_15910 [Planctomycetes bacterium]|nr:hypothetical protein [Planctomycetota bacterium]